MTKGIVLFIICISAYSGYANNDTLLIRLLLKDLSAMQVKQDDGEFYRGMFFASRECGGVPHNRQPDNNVFFTAITAFSLRNMLPYLDEANKALAKNIISEAATSYPNFRNRFGYPFYNFWPTYAPIMPHTYYFKYLKGVFGQGEDADDSVMVLMTSENNDSSNMALKSRMISVSNRSQMKIISTYKKYRSYPAYSTWLGKKMTPDFDFSVQCNILYFMYDKKLAMVKQDSATVDLLSKMIEEREYMKHPVYISPYYVKSSVELYHISRLISAFDIPQLERFRPQIIKDIRTTLQKSTNVLEQVLLSTSLLRLGATATAINFKSLEEFEKSNQAKFIFFQARPAFSYPTPFKQLFLH